MNKDDVMIFNFVSLQSALAPCFITGTRCRFWQPVRAFWVRHSGIRYEHYLRAAAAAANSQLNSPYDDNL